MDSSRQALQTNRNLFPRFQIHFRIISQIQKNIQTNSKVRIMNKFQCVTYQLIRFDKLYKLMKSFFQISESFFELSTIFKNIKIVALGLLCRIWSFYYFQLNCLFLIRLLSKVAGKGNTAEISSILFWETRYSN